MSEHEEVTQALKVLKKHIRVSGLSRRQVAMQAGVKYEWLTKFYHGKIANPTLRNINPLRSYLERAA